MGLAINALIGHIEKAPRKPVQFTVNMFPGIALVEIPEVQQMGLHSQLFRLWFPNNLIVHRYPPIQNF